MDEINLFGESYPHHEGVSSSDIQDLFTYWKETFNKNSNTVLDEARSKKLSIALNAYGKAKCEKAIKGCSLSSWHTGDNPRNKKYNDISLIFRNSDKVEMFLELYETESQAQKELDKWINEE
jgi:hypothetical protein